MENNKHVKSFGKFNENLNISDDFECVWQKEITNSMNQTKTYKPIEKLFQYGG